MFDFFRKLFAPERSSETAKERLRLVLLSDHLSLAPETVEALKKDLLEVISRYVDIDAGAADVTFEQRDHEVAMLASIPITGVRDLARDLAAAPAPAITEVPMAVAGDAAEAATELPALSPASSAAQEAAASGIDERPATQLAPARASDSEAKKIAGDFAAVPARSGNAARPRRRRRKKSAAAAATTAATTAKSASVAALASGDAKQWAQGSRLPEHGAT